MKMEIREYQIGKEGQIIKGVALPMDENIYAVFSKEGLVLIDSDNLYNLGFVRDSEFKTVELDKMFRVAKDFKDSNDYLLELTKELESVKEDVLDKRSELSSFVKYVLDVENTRYEELKKSEKETVVNPVKGHAFENAFKQSNDNEKSIEDILKDFTDNPSAEKIEDVLGNIGNILKTRVSKVEEELKQQAEELREEIHSQTEKNSEDKIDISSTFKTIFKETLKKEGVSNQEADEMIQDIVNMGKELFNSFFSK